MSDDKRRRFPRPGDYERPSPDTERSFIPPPPPTPSEPFRMLTANEVPRPSWLIPTEFRDQIHKLIAGHNQVLQTQRQIALQVDGLGSTVNQRFDVFHRELSLLRATVLEHGGRMDRVESSLGQKAAAVAGAGLRGTVWLAIGSVLSHALPQYGSLIERILGGLQ